MLVYFLPFGIFDSHLVYFMAFGFILWSFGIFFPVLEYCTKKNLATLVLTANSTFGFCEMKNNINESGFFCCSVFSLSDKESFGSSITNTFFFVYMTLQSGSFG
jgi:hypothetical protein